MEVETGLGRDYLVLQPTAKPLSLKTPDGTLEATGRATVISLHDKTVAWAESEGGTVTWNGALVAVKR
jgi:hypothetical protein